MTETGWMLLLWLWDAVVITETRSSTSRGIRSVHVCVAIPISLVGFYPSQSTSPSESIYPPVDRRSALHLARTSQGGVLRVWCD